MNRFDPCVLINRTEKLYVFDDCRGCDVNVQNHHNFDTPLHLAAYRGHLDICRLLVGHRASVAVRNLHGRSPIEEALAQKHTQVTQFLTGSTNSFQFPPDKNISF